MTSLLLVLSWLFIIFGIIGIFKFKSFYGRLITSSKIDSAALLLILTGLALHLRDSYFTSRYLMILLFMFITNPVTTHLIAKKRHKEDEPWKP